MSSRAKVFVLSVALFLLSPMDSGAQTPDAHLGLDDFQDLSIGLVQSRGSMVAPRFDWDGPPPMTGSSPNRTGLAADAAAGAESGRSFLARAFVSGGVGGLAGYLLARWIDGRGDCVFSGIDESRCRFSGAGQQGFVVGMSVGVLISTILHFW